MVRHLLFYDEPGAISARIGAEDGVDDGNDADTVGFAAGGPIGSFGANRKKDKTLKWMWILFLSMLMLLILQLLLGWLARALSLLADSGHSAADVVSYGCSLWIEWMKLAPELGTSKSEVTSEKVARYAKTLDVVGSLISLFILLFATCLATLEAVSRIQVPSEMDSGRIGLALLVYAILSTLVSIVLLVMYRRWLGKGAKKKGASNPAAAGKEIVAEALQQSPETIGRPTIALKTLQHCPPCKAQQLFDPTVDYSPDAQSKTEDYLSELHMWIHPGCTSCGSGDIDWGLGDPGVRVEGAGDVTESNSSGGRDVVVAARKMSRNLNLIATMLHLVTDLLRSVTILCVAILIQLEAVQDAEHGDAVCALVVACLIFVGSMALLLQVFGRLYACCKRNRVGGQSKPSKENENA